MRADFAVVPDRRIIRTVNDSVLIVWDFTSMRALRDFTLNFSFVTPTSGRIQSGYYYERWRLDNGRASELSGRRDVYRPTIAIDRLSPHDAGRYAVELTLSTSWMNTTQIIYTDLDVLGKYRNVDRRFLARHSITSL